MIEIIRANELPIEEIVTRYGPTDLDEENVERIASSMAEVGQIHPPLLIEDGKDYVLIVGRHRMEALRLLGWESAWFFVVKATGGEAEILALDENLCRKSIPWLEQCEMLLRREMILLSLDARALPGRPRHYGERASQQTTGDIAKELKVGKRTYQRQISIARWLCPEARELVRPLKLSLGELERLLQGRQKERQVEVARLLVSSKEVLTVSAALRMIRSNKASVAGPRFEEAGERYRVIHAVPSDWQDVLARGTVSLIVTYVDEATGGDAVWQSDTDGRYGKHVIAAHRELAEMAADVLIEGGSLLVTIASKGSGAVLAAMRQTIGFVDAIPFIVEHPDSIGWRSVLLFTKKGSSGASDRRLLTISEPDDSLCFDRMISVMSMPGDTVFDPYGHIEIAGSVIHLGCRYLGFQPTPDGVTALANKIEGDLMIIAENSE